MELGVVPMFLGTHTPKLDDKGRFFLPAKFRDELAEGLVVTRGQDRCLAIYPMATFMKNLVRSAAYSAVGAIPALEVNQEKNRQAITDAIRANVLRKLQDEKLEGILTLKSVLIRNLQPAKEIVDSATAVVTRQNELAAKKTEVSIAEEEAKRIAMLNSNSKAIEYMNAQATMEIAKALREGKVHAVVVPYDFKGIVNVPAK